MTTLLEHSLIESGLVEDVEVYVGISGLATTSAASIFSSSIVSDITGHFVNTTISNFKPEIFKNISGLQVISNHSTPLNLLIIPIHTLLVSSLFGNYYKIIDFKGIGQFGLTDLSTMGKYNYYYTLGETAFSHSGTIKYTLDKIISGVSIITILSGVVKKISSSLNGQEVFTLLSIIENIVDIRLINNSTETQINDFSQHISLDSSGHVILITTNNFIRQSITYPKGLEITVDFGSLTTIEQEILIGQQLFSSFNQFSKVLEHICVGQLSTTQLTDFFNNLNLRPDGQEISISLQYFKPLLDIGLNGLISYGLLSNFPIIVNFLSSSVYGHVGNIIVNSYEITIPNLPNIVKPLIIRRSNIANTSTVIIKVKEIPEIISTHSIIRLSNKAAQSSVTGREPEEVVSSNKSVIIRKSLTPLEIAAEPIQPPEPYKSKILRKSNINNKIAPTKELEIILPTKPTIIRKSVNKK